jgi:hypothetical protein
MENAIDANNSYYRDALKGNESLQKAIKKNIETA